MGDGRIFVSYSHRGRGPEWKAALLRALEVFDRHQLLDVWQDGRIRVGASWNDDIRQAMADARVAVVLLTPEALQSDYIVEQEYPFLRQRQRDGGLVVFPVVCEPCEWKAHDWLLATQAAEVPATDPDRVFRAIALEIADTISHLALGHEGREPERVYLDRFPLDEERRNRLFGREQELALLDVAFAHANTAIVSLVAAGGVGKTMLIEHWLRRLRERSWAGARRVYAWSFYTEGAEDSFLAHALDWFGVSCEPSLSPFDKGRLLADAVARELALLVLDGLEPLQHPPGPMAGRLRAGGVQTLLRHLARRGTASRALCLVTTRAPLTDLAGLERVLDVDLANLTDDDGAALLHHAGARRAGTADIDAGDRELLAASREVAGHALTLHLLGRFLARAHTGDIRRRDLVQFQEADRHERGGTVFRMLAAFERWFAGSGDFGARQLAVLRILGLFDRPADRASIEALRRPPAIAGLTEPLLAMQQDEDWNLATSFLADVGLVSMIPAADELLLDCHPLIREYFAAPAFPAAHRRLYEHFRDRAPRRPETLEAMLPLYRAVFHGCKAGLHDQACYGIYLDRIIRDTDSFYSVKAFGAFSEDLAAVTCFFERPWSRLAPSLPVEAQMSLLGTAAFHLQALGRLAEAVEPMRVSADLVENMGLVSYEAIAWNNLADLELLLGDLEGAMRDGARAVAVAKFLPMREQLMWRPRYARVLHQAGRFDEALDELRRCEAEYASVSPFGLLFSAQGFYYCELLLAEAERAAWHAMASGRRSFDRALLQTVEEVERRARKTLRIAERSRQPLDLAFDHLTLGRVAILRAILGGHPLEARASVETALDALRASGQRDEIVRGLLLRAWLRTLEHDAAGAAADLDEAWEIAERGPMLLHMADIHLHRARLFCRSTPYPWGSPNVELDAAATLIGQCGYHRRDAELADARLAIPPAERRRDAGVPP